MVDMQFANRKCSITERSPTSREKIKVDLVRQPDMIGYCIPTALRPLIRRLRAIPDLSKHDLHSILLIVRLGDELHKAFYASFLLLSLVATLRETLDIEDLDVEVEVYKLKWQYRQGTVSVTHRISSDYDMHSVNVLTKIAKGVLESRFTPEEGLRLIQNHVQFKQPYNKWEKCYREWPGRLCVLPLMAATCTTVYFGGTWVDLGFSAVEGLVAGGLACLGTYVTPLSSSIDYIVSMVISMIAVMAITYFPTQACYGAQVMGTLYWFLYGTAFVIGIYEITNNQLMTGLARFFSALIRTFGLAFGALIGLWATAYNQRGDRWDRILDDCTSKEKQIQDLWFVLLFPLSGIACLMQFRVSLKHFPLCLAVQVVAFGSQYVLETVWKQPDGVSNVIPAFLAAIASHFGVTLAHHLKFTLFDILDENSCEPKKDTLNDDIEENNVGDANMAGDGRLDQNLPSRGSSITHRKTIDRLLVEESETKSVTEDIASSIACVDEGWARDDGDGKSTSIGYVRAGDDRLAYHRSDMFFCLLPALYLLVPGSKIFQTAFAALIENLSNAVNLATVQNLGTTMGIIALSQVIGVRLGLTTIRVGTETWSWIAEKINQHRDPSACVQTPTLAS